MQKTSLFVCIGIFLVMVTVTENIGLWRQARVLKWDSAAYHVYLPALIIHKDIRNLAFYDTIGVHYEQSADVIAYGTHIHPETGYRVNKYPVGVSLFQLPLFLAVHFYALIKYPESIDGYNPDYQRSVSYSTLIFVFLGLLVLRRFLLFYLEDRFVWPVLLILGLGTNLYHYSAFDYGLSHGYLFFLYACVLWTTVTWYKTFEIRHAILLGFLLGLTMITRPTDILLAIIPLLWLVHSRSQMMDVISKKWVQILLAVGVFLSVVALQMIYWKTTTGDWIYYSYQGEGFNFKHPNILNGLFSYRKGWFVYTPLALLGFAGMYYIIRDKQTRFYSWPFFIYYILTIYLVFSWENWYYGGGFGSRVMVQSYPLLALPIGVLLGKIYTETVSCRKCYLTLVIVLGIGLNMFQSYQYHKAIIHWDSMNKAMYWQRFLKAKHPPEGFPPVN